MRHYHVAVALKRNTYSFVQITMQGIKYINHVRGKLHNFQNTQYQGKQIIDIDYLCPSITVVSVTVIVFSLWVNHATPAVDIKLLEA